MWSNDICKVVDNYKKPGCSVRYVVSLNLYLGYEASLHPSMYKRVEGSLVPRKPITDYDTPGVGFVSYCGQIYNYCFLSGVWNVAYYQSYSNRTYESFFH